MLDAGLTAVVFLGLTLFAFKTKIDFTRLHNVFFVPVLILLIFVIIAMIWPGQTINLVVVRLYKLTISLYLIYHTQMMIGNGKHKYSISEEYIVPILNLYSLSTEEYIAAILNLYLNIIYFFPFPIILILDDSL